jgi:gamma-glutamylcyclotransferase (GGCT)/AIG2-like uncharacterized protein YtfP
VSDYLFVYGTLLPGTASETIGSILRRVRRVGEASVRGVLHDMGNYPAFTLDPRGESIVRGELLIVPSPAAWMRLDLYEGFNRANPQLSLFRRQPCIATKADGEEVECSIYVYNRDVSNSAQIPSGCWRTHLSQLDEIVVP